VPLPLPISSRSPVTLALYLFLNSGINTCINTLQSTKKGLPFRILCYRLNISTGRGETTAFAHIKNALDNLTNHLETLAKQGVDVPDCYEITQDFGSTVRFQAIPRLHRPSNADTEADTGITSIREYMYENYLLFI
jgi:hypothetical protein